MQLKVQVHGCPAPSTSWPRQLRPKGKGKPARRWQVFLQDLDRKNLIASAERPAAGAGLQGQRPCLPSHTGISEHGKHSKRSLNAAGVFSLDTRYPKTTPTLPPHSDSPTSVSTDEPIRRTRGILATRKENEKRPAAYESSPVRVVACIPRHACRVS